MLSIEKVRVVLGAVHTSQNRAFLATVFACGLRIQEARHLEVYDIDSQPTMVHAHRGKRAKDPFVPLPKSTLRRLRTHWATHRHPALVFPALDHFAKCLEGRVDAAAG